ncbi:MAG: hypothetical protein HYY78_05840 [Betaproteobacteria bacterium]|nr:hypothetical protein [Betaproteobacteria bacterium]
MKKLLAAIVAGMFALTTATPALAQAKKKDMTTEKTETKATKKKGEQKKMTKGEGKKTEGKKLAKKGAGKKKEK